MNHGISSWISLLGSTLRVSTPLLLAALGGLMSERSGVINIALEGLMTMGAFAGAAVAYTSHSPWVGAGAAALAGLLLAVVYAFFVIGTRTDQIVAGTAINFLAFGVVPLLTHRFFDSGVSTPDLAMAERFQSAPLVWAFALAVLMHLWLKFWRSGLWLQIAGENPEALATAGISVRKIRWMGVLMSGVLAGLGGASLSIYLSSSYSRGMVGGRGFMALAALIFGKWRPIPTLLACLFFGFADAIQIRLQGVVLWGADPVPVQFIQIIPYALTIFVLAGFVGKSRAPKSLGTAWKGASIALACVVSTLFLSSCEMPNIPTLQDLLRPKTRTVPKSASYPSPQEELGALARRSKQNSEILSEMQLVLLRKPPENRSMFGNMVDILNQGASFEGVLNGWTHSEEFHALERSSKPASTDAIGFFIQEFSLIQGTLSQPMPFSPALGKPEEAPQFPTGSEDLEFEASPTPKPAPIRDPLIWQVKSAPIFSKSSLLTLKRVLADAVILQMGELTDQPIDKTTGKKSDQAASNQQRLIDWYADTAMRLIARNVDFGIPLRNKPDRAFHVAWAKQILATSPLDLATDRILWETLNREFRVLNALDPVPGAPVQAMGAPQPIPAVSSSTVSVGLPATASQPQASPKSQEAS